MMATVLQKLYHLLRGLTSADMKDMLGDLPAAILILAYHTIPKLRMSEGPRFHLLEMRSSLTTLKWTQQRKSRGMYSMTINGVVSWSPRPSMVWRAEVVRLPSLYIHEPKGLDPIRPRVFVQRLRLCQAV